MSPTNPRFSRALFSTVLSVFHFLSSHPTVHLVFKIMSRLLSARDLQVNFFIEHVEEKYALDSVGLQTSNSSDDEIAKRHTRKMSTLFPWL